MQRWPYRGSVTRVDNLLMIHIDARQDPHHFPGYRAHTPLYAGLEGDAWRREAEQVYALAHEIGHVALGHYQLRNDDGYWHFTHGDSEDILEVEADHFAALVTRTPGFPLALMLKAYR